jgi:tetratricopeptide (TPR) repeat protein
LAQALNGRCWARALAGRDLDKALNDCNRAVRDNPKTSAFLDSRGLVYLRMGDLPKAIADYDAALALRPGAAWSLYGRGLAKARLGMKTDGQADLAAAVAVDPTLPDKAKTYGIAAP